MFNHSKMLSSSLFMFSDNCSVCTFLKLVDALNEHSGLIKLVSSTYSMVLKFLLASRISFIYMMKSRGPKIEPCGTPVVIRTVFDKVPS